MRTKEGLDVAYGVYFYVVEMDGVSEKKDWQNLQLLNKILSGV